MSRYIINTKQPNHTRHFGHLFSVFILLMAGSMIGLILAVQYINYVIGIDVQQQELQVTLGN